MANFARHVFQREAAERSDPVGVVRALNAYALQMVVAGGFAGIGFGLFLMAPNHGLGLFYWFAGIVFGAHFSDKIYAWARNVAR